MSAKLRYFNTRGYNAVSIAVWSYENLLRKKFTLNDNRLYSKLINPILETKNL